MLLDAIVTGDLAQGARLNEAELVTRFDVTLASVRGALAELDSQWLVRVVPRQGTFVADLDRGRGIQAIEVLTATGARASRDSQGRLTDEHRRRLSAFRRRWLRDLDTMREAYALWVEETDLYSSFFEAAGNPDLVRLKDWVRPYAQWMRHEQIASGGIDYERVLARQRGMVDAALDDDLQRTSELLAGDLEPLLAFYGGRAADAPRSYPGATLTRELVADTIERAILGGTLVPGEPLPETELMAWLRVSHTPIRQALSVLAQRGLVEQGNRRSVRVATVDETRVRQTFEAVSLLLGIGYRRGMREDRAGLAALLRKHLDHYRSEPDAPVSEMVSALSADVFDFSGAVVAAELMGRMSARLRWFLARADEQYRERALDVVARIADAVERGDAPGIDAALDEDEDAPRRG